MIENKISRLIKLLKGNSLLCILALTFMVFIAFDIYWITNSNSQIVTYEDVHILNEVNDLYLNTHNFFELIPNLFYYGYSPVPKIITLFFTYIFGVMRRGVFFINIGLLALSFILLYKSLKKIYNKEISIIALILLMGFPAATYFLRSYYDQLYLLFFYLLSFFLLIKSDNFKLRKYSVLYGISLGLFALTRYSSFPYLLSEVVYIIIINLKACRNYFRKITKKPLKSIDAIFSIIIGPALAFFSYILTSNLALFAGIAVISFLVSILIINNLSENKVTNLCLSLLILFYFCFIEYVPIIPSLASAYTSEALQADKLSVGIGSFTYYPLVYLRIHANALLFLITASMIIYYFFGRNHRSKNDFDMLLLLSILLPWLFFSVFTTKNNYVSFLIIIPIAIISSISISRLKNHMFKYALIGIFIFSAIYYACPLVSPADAQVDNFLAGANGKFHLNNLIVMDKEEIPVLGVSKYFIVQENYTQRLADSIGDIDNKKIFFWSIDDFYMSDILINYYPHATGITYYNELELEFAKENGGQNIINNYSDMISFILKKKEMPVTDGEKAKNFAKETLQSKKYDVFVVSSDMHSPSAIVSNEIIRLLETGNGTGYHLDRELVIANKFNRMKNVYGDILDSGAPAGSNFTIFIYKTSS